MLIPDDPPSKVDERPARVARVDRDVGLEEVLIGVGGTQSQIVSGRGGDDPRADGPLQAEGAADRQDPVALLQLVRITPLGRERERPLDPDHCQVGSRVGADQLPRHLVPPHPDRDQIRAANDVLVGDDLAPVLVDHDPRPQVHPAILAERLGADMDDRRRDGLSRQPEQLRRPRRAPRPDRASASASRSRPGPA